MQEQSKIDHPVHYGGDTQYETIKVIEAWDLGFHLGNAVKYISRAGKKPGQSVIDDLKKAEWYIQREIARISADHKPQGEEQEPEEGLSDSILWRMWNKINAVVSIVDDRFTHQVIYIESGEIKNTAFNILEKSRAGSKFDLSDYQHVDIETRHRYDIAILFKATLYEVFEAISEQFPRWSEYSTLFFECAIHGPDVKPDVITATHNVVTTRIYFQD
jgi:hypothetical protein